LKVVVSIVIMVFSFVASQTARAQSPVATLALSPDRIGEIKTAPGITTMIRFPDPVQEIICGDLYDAATGKGTFVVQRSGTADHPGNEVFVKPVSSKGLSNMFVKTGDGKHTYSFDLSIASTPQAANRMVNVTDLSTPSISASNNGTAEDRHASDTDKSTAEIESPKAEVERLKAEADGLKAEVERLKAEADGLKAEVKRLKAEADGLKAEAEQQALQKAAEILRNAQQQADRKIAEADAKLAEADRLAPQRAHQEIERRFLQALMLGLRETKVANTRATTKKVIITLDPHVRTFAERAYLRYTIQNNGDKDFTFTSVSIEFNDGKESKLLTAEVSQSKAMNLLAPIESLTGIIVFDPKQVGPKQRLTFFVRGEGSAELAHLTIQE
jgi:predicted  nucleic acid-binding Zn-ribbon protein